MKYTVFIKERQFEVEIQQDGSVLVNGHRHEVDILELGNSLFSIIQDTRSMELAIDDHQNSYEILLEGRLYEAQVLDQRAMLMLNRKGGAKLGSGEVNAPMPGLIVDVLVKVGDTVSEGDTLVILESMKMQNELKAPRPGKIQTVHCKAGNTVDKGSLLVIIAAEES
jgi:biotin carboxyl carrier protein